MRGRSCRAGHSHETAGGSPSPACRCGGRRHAVPRSVQCLEPRDHPRFGRIRARRSSAGDRGPLFNPGWRAGSATSIPAVVLAVRGGPSVRRARTRPGKRDIPRDRAGAVRGHDRLHHRAPDRRRVGRGDRGLGGSRPARLPAMWASHPNGCADLRSPDRFVRCLPLGPALRPNGNARLSPGRCADCGRGAATADLSDRGDAIRARCGGTAASQDIRPARRPDLAARCGCGGDACIQ